MALTPIAERLAVEQILHVPVLRLSRFGVRTPNRPLVGLTFLSTALTAAHRA